MKMLTLSLLAFAFAATSARAELVLYTDRPTTRLQPAAERFEALTGEKVTIVEASYKDLAKRLDAEGRSTPADLLMTKDLVYLGDAVKKGFLQPMRLSPSVQTVRSAMRDPGNRWVAITFRARTLAYIPSRTNGAEINSYEDLADAKWAGRLCLRTSSAAYNEALVANLIASRGESVASATVKGWVENLAAPIFPNDTSLLEAIAAGQCEVGIVNHYYLAQLHATNPNFPVKIKFLEQSGRGVHTNGTGIGIVGSSKKQDLAQRFIELLLTSEFQIQLSNGHLDYPAVEGLLPASLIRSWGTFKADSTPWTSVSNYVNAARKIMKEAGYK